MAKGFVYFIFSPANGLVKVGYTADDPDLRLRRLRATCPVPLEPMGLMAGGVEVERRIHHRFAHLNSHGEWFTLDATLGRFIRANAGPWTPREPKFRRSNPRPGSAGRRLTIHEIDDLAISQVKRLQADGGVPEGWRPNGWPWPPKGEAVDWMTSDGEIIPAGRFIYRGRQFLDGEGRLISGVPPLWRPAVAVTS